MPGGDAVCHGHHVWDEDECLRCGLLDLTYHEKPQPAVPDHSPTDLDPKEQER